MCTVCTIKVTSSPASRDNGSPFAYETAICDPPRGNEPYNGNGNGAFFFLTSYGPPHLFPTFFFIVSSDVFCIFCAVPNARTADVRPTLSRIRLIKILAPRLTSCLAAVSLVTHSAERARARIKCHEINQIRICFLDS